MQIIPPLIDSIQKKFQLKHQLSYSFYALFLAKQWLYSFFIYFAHICLEVLSKIFYVSMSRDQP